MAGKTKKETETVSTVKKQAFKLPDIKVNVRFVKRQTGYINNPRHVAYGGKLEGACDHLPAKQSRSGKYVTVLNEVEQRYLEKLLAIKEDGLSIHKTTDNFWDDINIMLCKEGTVMDLSDPYDYINYKVLLTYTDLISPSITETLNKRTYKFEIVTANDENLKLQKHIDYKRKAYKLLEEIESSREQLAGILRIMTGKPVSTESNHDWLITQVGKEIDSDAKRFVEILEDDDYQIKLLIEKAIDEKKIYKERGLYKTSDGLELCYEGQIATLDNAVMFLKDSKNQDIKLLIK